MLTSGSIQDWGQFYLTVAAASATLVGLLYVAIALTPEIIADESRDDLRSLARATFGNFLNVFVLSLTVLVPWSQLWALGAVVIGWALLGIARSLRALRHALGEEEPAFERHIILRRVGLPVVSEGLVVIAGIALVAGTTALFWLIAVDIFFGLTQAAFGTWDLLGLIGQAKQDRMTADDGREGIAAEREPPRRRAGPSPRRSRDHDAAPST